jgi:acetyl esterase
MADEPDPQVQVLLDMLEERNTPPTYGVSPEAAREQYLELTEMVESEPVAETQDFEIEGPGGPIPVRAYIPGEEGPYPILVYYHGGGWVIGDIETHDNVCSALCNRAEVVVLSVDYRLAPENPFPAALEDAYAALEWATTYGDEISGDPDRVAIGGDSAGGNLSTGVTLMADDEDGPEIAHQSLIYPAVASPAVHEFDSYEENGEGYFLEQESMDWFYGKYVQNDAHARNEYLAPLLARDLSGVPPATVVTAGFDPLRDEGAAYADRLEEAGVDVHHENFEGMIHGFVQLPDMIDRAEDALDLLAEELQASLAE